MPSTVIRAFSYDPDERTLAVTFTSGRRYRYHDVPPELHQAMSAAFSKGEFFNRRIRNRFAYSPVREVIYPGGPHAPH